MVTLGARRPPYWSIFIGNGGLCCLTKKNQNINSLGYARRFSAGLSHPPQKKNPLLLSDTRANEGGVRETNKNNASHGENRIGLVLRGPERHVRDVCSELHRRVRTSFGGDVFHAPDHHGTGNRVLLRAQVPFHAPDRIHSGVAGRQE